MCRYLLDTNTVSYFIKGFDPFLVEKVTQTLIAQTALISVITRAELRYGQAGMLASDKRKRAVDLLLTQVTVLSWTSPAADVYGTLKNKLKRDGTPIGELDIQIAAHALAENLILVTHNTKHFDKVPGLKLEDWMVQGPS